METTAGDVIDLYEEMLYERAARGIRPVLYISSRADLECSVLMLLDGAEQWELGDRQHPSAGGLFGLTLMTN